MEFEIKSQKIDILDLSESPPGQSCKLKSIFPLWLWSASVKLLIFISHFVYSNIKLYQSIWKENGFGSQWVGGTKKKKNKNRLVVPFLAGSYRTFKMWWYNLGTLIISIGFLVIKILSIFSWFSNFIFLTR